MFAFAIEYHPYKKYIMLHYFYESQQNLDARLKQIEIEESKVLKQAERSVHEILEFLKDWKEYIHGNTFENQENEIIFFKKIKPEVFSQLIYYIGIYNIESRKPTGRDAFQKKYYRNEIRKIENFCLDHQEFHKYMRNDYTYLDDKYFIRGKFELSLVADCSIFNSDPEFSTTHDCLVSKILANDLLNSYLQSQIANLEQKDHSANKNYVVLKGKYIWTDTKTALVELIYAIHSIKCVNNGSIEIKEITKFFEYLFQIDLKDIYREFLNIKSRQNPTKFIDSLRTSLLKRIEQDE